MQSPCGLSPCFLPPPKNMPVGALTGIMNAMPPVVNEYANVCVHGDLQWPDIPSKVYTP